MLELYTKQTAAEKTMGSEPMENLKRRLMVLSQKIRERKIPVCVVLEGWGAAGKGTLISSLISELDPRGYKVYGITDATADESRYAWMHRFWLKVPQYGQMAFFDGSWYQETIKDRMEDEISVKEFDTRIEEILDFERQLCDDGYAIVKLFLHISRKEQRRRFEHLEEKKATSWRVTRSDIHQNDDYEDYFQAYDGMLMKTDQPGARWKVLEAWDEDYVTRRAYETLIDALEEALNRKEDPSPHLPTENGAQLRKAYFAQPILQLSKVDLSPAMDEQEYQKALKECHERLSMLHNKLYLKKIPVVLAYEGWDAAGKGGNIHRLASGLDPRGYEVIPIAAPSQAEKEHPFLWRFWQSLPKDGHIAIFDRSWYGRVMVERIEGFCSEVEWRRAYDEINSFERHLYDWGSIVLKFWLHIDKEEQLKRFHERESTPEKQYKITEEDWRNREKWDAYETAVDEMLQRTSTAWAPWTVVESNNKYFSRIKVLKTVMKAIEERL
jgi:polyphosphate:AMP phosphotransferase